MTNLFFKDLERRLEGSQQTSATHKRGLTMQWIDCNEMMPPSPETPYEVYLVWVVQQKDNATGGPQLHQLCRDTGTWLPLPRGPAGAPQVVTHWSDALSDMGSPHPQPYGPRGKTANVGGDARRGAASR